MAYKKIAMDKRDESANCPDHPDLLLLRDAAADEREAMALYMEAAKYTVFTELFLDAAEDEMHHYVMIMKHISLLDPIQTAELKEQNLDMLTMDRFKAKWQHKYCVPQPAACNPMLPSEEDLEAVKHLTKALAAELRTINKFQRYMGKALNEHNKHLFCHLMNEEKEHVAKITAALFDLTHEPLPVEMD